LLFIYDVHKNISKNVKLGFHTVERKQSITCTAQSQQAAAAAAASLSDQDTIGTAHLFCTCFKHLCRFMVYTDNLKTNVHYCPA